ncbi:MAG TPA: metallophosphoesterase [Candidatus Bathyarchaeia archaeon]|nr:metallophosphoesterase [Candidatus Bathyarchaeia archaeon]
MTSRTEDVKQLTKKSLNASLKEFVELTSKVVDVLRAEGNHVGNMKVKGRLIELPAEGEAIVVGDLHGDLETLAQILETSEFLQKTERDESARILFLGDYGDRGMLSPETYYVVLKLKASLPEHVVLMRGNHEGPDDLRVSPHDLPAYLHNRFGEGWSEAYVKLKELFSYLNTAVLVEDHYVLLHGGVPSQAKSIDDLAYAHSKHPHESHLEEILWSDPEEGLKGTYPSPRGAGKLFGEDVTERFLNMLKVKVLIRGHEPANAGFKINHGGRILTLFSRKGEPYFNSQGAFLRFNLAEGITDAFHLKPFVTQL